MNPVQLTIKRLLDVTGAFLIAVVLSPLLLLIGLVIRLTSPGPIIFCQKRMGKAGKPFVLYKFRSMYDNAPDIRNGDGSTFNAMDDPRVTPVGCFLRRTSLDELPQLVNVLQGDMSLVGPRPDQLDQLSYYTPQEKRRLLVKPGITGLAQINGRNSISWERRKQLDLEYVERQSLRLDLEILLRTIPYVLARRDVFFGETLETIQ